MTTKRWMALVAIPLWMSAGGAFGQASKSLDKCQKEAANQTAKFVNAQVKAMANCMQKISGKVVKSNEAIAGAAKACSSAFRKIENSVAPSKELVEKAIAKIRKKCDDTFNAELAHTTDQVLSLAPMGVPEGIEAKNLDNWCTNFDGDGSIDSVQEWIGCLMSISQCHARQQMVFQYPRVIEWANGLQPAILALGADPKYTDAATAVQEMVDAIDRFANLAPTINCGPGVDSCGNGVKDGNDDCDGSDLGGAGCATIGFRSGTLACGGDCHFDVSGCVTGAFPATGQTASFLAGDDGDLEKGAVLSFTDNGNGTITDDNTGLVWEKKDRGGGIHDQGNTYLWVNVKTSFIDVLNTGPCFAGHCDWRVPNYQELSTIIDYGKNNAAVPTVFDNNCTAGCTSVLGTSCSCTPNNPYYTSTTYNLGSTNVWTIDMGNGQIVNDPKGTARRVRAVRGGL